MKFTIYGERCSGTNYLAKLIQDNFESEYVLLPDSINGSKHFFGNDKNVEAIKNSKDCIVFCIVRNPIDWIMSFYNSPHQQDQSRISNLLTFISSSFHSNLQWDKRELELNVYKDIFEMRRFKCRFLYCTIPNLTLKSYFINYENLKHSPISVLSEIKKKFQLTSMQNEFVIEKRKVVPQGFELMINMPLQVTGSKKFDLSDEPVKENYVIQDAQIREIIKTRLDLDTEEMIGYSRESILSRIM